ncbi:indolepyruvate ferredoxin oxidoreductase subunit alpha [Candidatus Pyrohabitans sp.]
MVKFNIAVDEPGRRVFLLGNHAIARGALEAGVRVAAAYPGTPSSEILQAIAGVAAKLGIHAEWSVNEKVALEVAIGASYAGARALAAMKHVGVNVALDALATLAYTGVKGGLVLVSADDPGMHSSQNEQDNRLLARFAKIPCLEPYDAQSAKDYTKFAFEVSEKLQTPVMLRTTTRVSHAKGDVTLGELPDYGKRRFGFQKDARRYVCVPAHSRALHPALNRRLSEIERYASKSELNRMQFGGEKGIITAGVARNYVHEAVQSLGAEVSLLELGITHPLPRELIRRFLSGVEEVLVVEELEPFIEEQVRALCGGVAVRGKDLLPREGELTPELVEHAVARFLGVEYSPPPRRSARLELPPRPPVLCPGCSHRALFYALKKVTKRKIYAGDIGCYTLGALEPLKAMDTCLCMGSGLSQAQGFYHAGVDEAVVALIGDSTFLHAGLTALLNAAYNGAEILVIILDNRTTAMTGHQPHPGTGVTATGEESFAVDFVALARTLGASYVAKVRPNDFEATLRVLEEALSRRGLRVVVAEEPCALLGRKLGLWKTPPEVVEERCEGYLCSACRACLRIGCPAVGWDRGRARIIEELCTGCGLCIAVCPNEAILEVEDDS